MVWYSGCGRKSKLKLKLKLEGWRPGRLAARASGGMSMASFTCSGRGTVGMNVRAPGSSNDRKREHSDGGIHRGAHAIEHRS